MNNKIVEIPIIFGEEIQQLKIPVGATILDINKQFLIICGDMSKPLNKRKFQLIAGGKEVEDYPVKKKYIGKCTYWGDDITMYLFEIL